MGKGALVLAQVSVLSLFVTAVLWLRDTTGLRLGFLIALMLVAILSMSVASALFTRSLTLSLGQREREHH
jgi:hypothetical protein